MPTIFYGLESFQVLSRQLQAMDEDSTERCMVGFYISNTLSPHGGLARGYCDVVNGRLAGIVERFDIRRAADGVIRYEEDGNMKTMRDDDMVSMNAWGFPLRLFGFLERGFTAFLEKNIDVPGSEYLLPELIDGMIKKGDTAVRVLPSGEKWMGVTYADDKPVVMAGIRGLIDAGVYPEKLWT